MTPEQVLGNIYRRVNIGHRGDTNGGGGPHQFDHATYLPIGEIDVRREWPDGHVIEESFVAPEILLIEKHVKHLITHRGQTEKSRAPHVQQLLLSAMRAGLVDAVAEFLASEERLPSQFDCIYAHRLPNGTVTEKYTGFRTAYT